MTNQAESLANKLIVKTALGDFAISLSTKAPDTSNYFLDLAKKRALDNGKIFRITTVNNQNTEACHNRNILNTSHPIEVIQVGTQAGINMPRDQIPHESTRQSQLQHKKWTVSAARFTPGEVYKSFFICMRDEPGLDAGGNRNPDGHGFAAFGHISNGFSVLENIFEKAESNEILTSPIDVHSCQVL